MVYNLNINIAEAEYMISSNVAWRLRDEVMNGND